MPQPVDDLNDRLAAETRTEWRVGLERPDGSLMVLNSNHVSQGSAEYAIEQYGADGDDRWKVYTRQVTETPWVEVGVGD